MAYIHGTKLEEDSSGTREIAVEDPNTIAIFGTAPDSEPASAASLKTGVVLSNNALTWTAASTGKDGNSIAILLRDPRAPNATLSVQVNARVVTVSLATDGDGVVTTTAAQVITAITGSANASALVTVANTGASTGVNPVAPIRVQQNLTGGVNEAFPLNTPVLVLDAQQAKRAGSTGTIPTVIKMLSKFGSLKLIVVRVAAGVDDEATIANLAGDSLTYTGVWAAMTAKTITGFDPKILIAPWFTHQLVDGGPNPVAIELAAIVDRLKAFAYIDAPPDGDESDTINARGRYESMRMTICYPFVTYFDGETRTAPMSIVAAGLTATRKTHESPSNVVVPGITGTTRAIDYVPNDPNCRANILNSNEITTVINLAGLRLWGSRTLSSDPRWKFINVRRIGDLINQSVLVGTLWATDRGITKTFLEDVAGSVNKFLARQRADGAILGGECWASSRNNADEIASGIVYFEFKFTPVYPAETIMFTSRKVDDYIEEIL